MMNDVLDFFSVKRFCIICGLIVLLMMPGLISVVSQSNTKPTINNAKHQLIKTYTRENKAYYVYKLTWPKLELRKVEYSVVIYKSENLGDGMHSLEANGVKYFDVEPIPDDYGTYKIENVETNTKLLKATERNHDYLGFYPLVLPIIR